MVRLFLRCFLFALLAMVTTAVEDSLFRLRSSSQRGGRGNQDVPQLGEELDAQLRKVLSAETARAVVYLDALWSIDSKLGAFDSLLEVSEHLADYDVPTFVLNHASWWPKSGVFENWWSNQSIAFGGTKYRAILLFVVKGQLRRGFQNFVRGEGGSACVAAAGSRALMLQEHKLATDLAISSYCDAAAEHSKRETSVWMDASRGGWGSSRSYDTMDELGHPKPFPGFGVDMTCLWPWALVPYAQVHRTLALTGAPTWVSDLWPEDPGCPDSLSDPYQKATSPLDASSTLRPWIDAYDGPDKDQRCKTCKSVCAVVSEHMRRAASVTAALKRLTRGTSLKHECQETLFGHVQDACECARQLWDSLGSDDEAFRKLFNLASALRATTDL